MPRCGPEGGSLRTAGSSRSSAAPPTEPSSHPSPLGPSPGGTGPVRKDDGAMSLISRLLECRSIVAAPSRWSEDHQAGRRLHGTTGSSATPERQLHGKRCNRFSRFEQPGVVVLPDNPAVIHPGIPPDLAEHRQGLGLRHLGHPGRRYTPADDILSIGIEQPPSQQTGQPGPVIAGDADNNGNDGTVNPAVTAVERRVPGLPGLWWVGVHGGLP